METLARLACVSAVRRLNCLTGVTAFSGASIRTGTATKRPNLCRGSAKLPDFASCRDRPYTSKTRLCIHSHIPASPPQLISLLDNPASPSYHAAVPSWCWCSLTPLLADPAAGKRGFRFTRSVKHGDSVKLTPEGAKPGHEKAAQREPGGFDSWLRLFRVNHGVISPTELRLAGCHKVTDEPFKHLSLWRDRITHAERIAL